MRAELVVNMRQIPNQMDTHRAGQFGGSIADHQIWGPKNVSSRGLVVKVAVTCCGVGSNPALTT